MPTLQVTFYVDSKCVCYYFFNFLAVTSAFLGLWFTTSKVTWSKLDCYRSNQHSVGHPGDGEVDWKEIKGKKKMLKEWSALKSGGFTERIGYFWFDI